MKVYIQKISKWVKKNLENISKKHLEKFIYMF